MEITIEVESCYVCPLLRKNGYGFKYCIHPKVRTTDLPQVNCKEFKKFPKNCPALKKEEIKACLQVFLFI